ncbi:G patch domain-containing protein 11 [Chelonus insularis]|uniref:G patch domain-containing protein 11 n=1 Tax=Chelonus insularis TaxID=460826 RepID=UPI00158E4FCE|nr:G patch domain-containing protein 11 [Chelonus insularis]XP_034938163.1 G patch domain-containing protein 11 [Chelonus insularis]
MSDDEDYMSDKILQGLEEKSTPGLIYKTADKRRIQAEKRKAEIDAKLKEKYKSPKILEQDLREKKLSSTIDAENKGFAMLVKMGYKPGQGIGKNESGRVEPIGINIKANRQGLGTIDKTKPTKSNINPTAKLENLKTDDFRDRIFSKKMQQLLENDLYKSQKVCEQLDSNNNIKEPIELWYWPAKEIEKNIDDDESDGNNENEIEKDDKDEVELLPKDKLEILTEYLRNKYFYCIWCGTTYNDQDDLTDNCPGPTRDSH